MKSIINLFSKFTRVFILNAVLLLSFSGIAMAEQNNEYIYRIEKDGVVLTSYIATPSDATKVEVPSEINGMKVIGLERTFYENQTIKTVVLPEGIRFLGRNTFNDCETLSEINFPNSLEEIGERCFYNTGLTEVVLPGTVKTLDGYAFSNCKRLIRLDLRETNAKWNYGCTFEDCVNLTEIMLPETLERIPSNMFEGCTSLVEITCPKNLKSIGPGAFRGCSSLSKIELSDKLESIGSVHAGPAGGNGAEAFKDCVSLQEIELPDSLKVIGISSFEGCINLKKINLPENLEYIGDWAFSSCDSLEEFTLPGNLTHENIGNAIVSGKKIRKIINHTPYNLDKRIFESIQDRCTWYADENCTKPAELLPRNSVIYRSKTELYGNMCLDLLPKADVFINGVNMADMNSKEETAAYLCTLLPSSEEVSYSIDISSFWKAWAGTKKQPAGSEGYVYASDITITVQNNYSEIDKTTVRFPWDMNLKITIHPTVYGGSDNDNPSSGSSGSGGGSSSGSSSGSGSGSSSGGGSGSGSGNSSGRGSGSGSGNGSGGRNSSSSSNLNEESTSAALPAYVVQGTWSQSGEQWSFTDASGETYRNRWAAVYNPYANTSSGQSNFDWFWFDENGVMITGWHLDSDGNYYYLNPFSDGTKGRMVTGWVWIADGTGVQKCYYFNPVSDGTRGKLITDTVVEGYTVNENGEWTVDGVVQIR